MTETIERHATLNKAMFFADYVAFNVGITFLGPSTILPTLVRQLGGSPLVVGSISTIGSGGWLLPQLFIGRYVSHLARVKKWIVIPAAVSRMCALVMAVILFLTARRAPAVALAGILVCWGGFEVFDAVSSVGWFDLLAKAIPLQQRGRLFGLAQSSGSLLGIGVGALIAAILARPNPFPNAYVLLIALAGLFTFTSVPALQAIAEPPADKEGESQIPWSEYLPRLRSIVRRDGRFVWMTVARWLAALSDMAGAFYILYAADRLHLPAGSVGLFTSAGVAGSAVAGLALGSIGDRHGARSVIRVTATLRCLGPILALLAPLAGRLQPWMGAAVLALVFAAQGAINSSFMTGFMNYMLEIAPANERSLYVGLANTLGGLTIFAPMLGGWLLQITSYETLFGLALAVALVAWVYVVRGPGARTSPVTRHTS